MSDIPNAEEQIPSIEDIFSSLEGHGPEEQVPVLAAILQAMLGQMSEMEKNHQDLCARVDAIDDGVYKPIQEGYKAKVRGMGIDGIKQKYGAKFDPILEPLKGFGIEDPYSTLYDMLEKMKEQGAYKEDEEGSYIDDQYNEAMKRINAIRGVKETPAAEAAPVEPPAEKPIATVEEKTVEVKPKEPEKAPEKPASLKDKKNKMASHFRDGY